MSTERIILGIDPGTNFMGYGLIKVEGNRLELLTLGVVKLNKVEDHALKLQKIFTRVLSIIDEFHPDEMAIEAQFFGKNVQSMLKLGRAQGVAIAAALSRNIPYVEYEPKKIKKSVTGNGSASKEQVAGMLEYLVAFKKTDEMLDATDALATAVCHYLQKPTSSSGQYHSSWKSFVSANPKRAK